MTASELLGAVRRLWYVVVVGVLLVAAMCLQLRQAPGSYWSQVDVVFLAPQSVRNPNTLGMASQSLIATAGVVANVVNQGSPETALSSSSVSLVGEGIRQGQSVRLPNAGGQWADNFDRPVLDVQVVGGDPRAVQVQIDDLVKRIGETLRNLQTAQGVPSNNRIVTESAPRAPVVQYIGSQSKRAMVATVLLGSLLTLAAVATLDRLLNTRAGTSRRAARPRTAAEEGL